MMKQFDRDHCEQCVNLICGDSLLAAVGTPLNSDVARHIEDPNEFRTAMEDITYRTLLERHSNYRAAMLEAAFGMSWLRHQHPQDIQAVYEFLNERQVEEQIRLLLTENNFPTRGRDGYEFAWQLTDTIAWCILDRIYEIPEHDSYSLSREEEWIIAGRLPCSWQGELPPLDARQGRLRDFRGLQLSQIVEGGIVCVL